MRTSIARSAAALAFALLVSPGALPAQTPEQRFLQLEQGWMDALSAQDTTALERVLATEFTIIGAGSTATEPPGSRAVWLANAMRFRWPRHAVRLLGVRPLGQATVVQAVLTATFPPRSITPEGGEITFLVTDTWVEREGRWQVVARHASMASAEEE